MRTEKKYLTCAETAKLVRQALKERFPGVKFSVTSKTYSGGASMNVGWEDGPTTKQVEAVTERFSGASFDGMIDLKSYHDSMLNGERVHFGADFIFCDRSYSVELLRWAVDKTCKHFGITDKPEVKWSEVCGAWIGVTFRNAENSNYSLSTEIMFTAQDKSMYHGPELISLTAGRVQPTGKPY